MAVMIQIRNVPWKVHRVLKARSALLGKSLSGVIRRAGLCRVGERLMQSSDSSLREGPETQRASAVIASRYPCGLPSSASVPRARRARSSVPCTARGSPPAFAA